MSGIMRRSRAFEATLLLLAAMIFDATALADPAHSPPGPALADAAEAFNRQAAARFREILAALAARNKLDDNRAILDRVRPIAAGLIAAAAGVRPETAGWSWEIHVTSDSSVAAFCMAGGKILVGSVFVERLELGDGELAMLLAHEIGHAVAGHRREAERGSMDSDVAEEARRTQTAVLQESEADGLGLRLACRAGWPASGLANFYEKLAAQESPGTFNSSHPPAASRVDAVKALLRDAGGKCPGTS